MTWSALYDVATGRLLSLATVVPSPLPTGVAIGSLTERPDFAVVRWDVGSQTLVARPPRSVPSVGDRMVGALKARVAVSTGLEVALRDALAETVEG